MQNVVVLRSLVSLTMHCLVWTIRKCSGGEAEVCGAGGGKQAAGAAVSCCELRQLRPRSRHTYQTQRHQHHPAYRDVDTESFIQGATTYLLVEQC